MQKWTRMKRRRGRSNEGKKLRREKAGIMDEKKRQKERWVIAQMNEWRKGKVGPKEQKQRNEQTKLRDESFICVHPVSCSLCSWLLSLCVLFTSVFNLLPAPFLLLSPSCFLSVFTKNAFTNNSLIYFHIFRHPPPPPR